MGQSLMFRAHARGRSTMGFGAKQERHVGWRKAQKPRHVSGRHMQPNETLHEAQALMGKRALEPGKGLTCLLKREELGVVGSRELEDLFMDHDHVRLAELAQESIAGLPKRDRLRAKRGQHVARAMPLLARHIVRESEKGLHRVLHGRPSATADIVAR